MSNPRSKSLLGDTRQVVQQVPVKTSTNVAIVDQKKDYLFKDEVRPIDEETERRRYEVNQRFNFEKLQTVSQDRRVFGGEEEQAKRFLERANTRAKRHYALNGDVVVYTKVTNRWPRLTFESLLVSLDPTDDVPELKSDVGEDETLVKTVFRPLTVSLRKRLEPFIFDVFKIGEQSTELYFDLGEYRRLVFMMCFKSWNLPVELDLTGEGADERLNMLHPKLVERVADDFIALNELSETEESVLDKQCDSLFAKNSKGVSHAVEGIKLYCEASVFAKEFATSTSELCDLPYRVVSLVRRVAHNYNEEQKRQWDEEDKKRNKPTPKKKR